MEIDIMMKKIFWLNLFGGCFSLLGWSQDTIVDRSEQFRKVVIEEYTGMHCPNCPSGHKVAAEIQASYPEECFLINIHAGNLATPYPGEVDLRSAYGTELADRAGVSAIPSAAINRHRFSGMSGLTTSNREDWFPMAEEILGMETYVNVGATAKFDWQSREMEVKVQLFYTGEPAVEENYIHAVLIQNNIEGTQDGSAANPDQVLPNGKYLHQHVLREMFTDIAGDATPVGKEGDLIERIYRKEIPESINGLTVDEMQLEVIVFVSEGEEDILNACKAPVVFENGPEYVFQMETFQQVVQPTCDAQARLSFNLINRNPSDKPVHSVTIGMETPEGKSHEYTVSMTDFSPESVESVITDAFELDKTGVETEVEVWVKGVNGKPLSQIQNPVKVNLKKEFVKVGTENVVLDIWQDRWGSETSWDLTDENGAMIASVAAYQDLDGDGVKRHTHNIKLSEGCHVFVIRDAMKDGINNGDGEGHLQLADANGSVLLSNDGTFTDSLLWLMKYSEGVPVEPLTSSVGMHVWPNPTEGAVKVSFLMSEAGSVRIDLMNIYGKVLMSREYGDLPSGNHVFDFSLEGLPSGLYLLSLSTVRNSYVRKVVLR